jgi:ADP-ribose pyrophosphatase YjhB (NUDIX family)
LPGGELETGESFEEAINRELKEEINVIPRNLRYLGRVNIPGYNTGIFIGWLVDNEVKKLKLGDEGQELRFFSFDEIKIDELALNLRDYFLRYGKYINEAIGKDLEISPAKLGLS